MRVHLSLEILQYRIVVDEHKQIVVLDQAYVIYMLEKDLLIDALDIDRLEELGSGVIHMSKH